MALGRLAFAELGVQSANAERPINTLVDAGVLTEFTGFRRNRMWQSHEVIAALDEFAARASPERLFLPPGRAG